jgi:paraquat-inducible protein A
MILPPQEPESESHNSRWIGCTACGLPHAASEHIEGTRCNRCGSALHRRKPDSVARTWALVLAALVLYIPANLYPVMTVVNLGRERPTTILEGVRELWNGNDWPYAFLVFAASIVIPLFKLIGMSGFLLSYHRRNRKALMHCTRFYRLFDRIGRWSVLDIFVAAILGALVNFGNLASIIPGPGLLPFALVVVLTIAALASFDPRLIWDAAGANDER